MTPTKPVELPEARVVRRRDRSPLLHILVAGLGVVLALVFVLGAWTLGPIVPGVAAGLIVLVLATNWGLRRWISESEVVEPQTTIPDGECVYRLQPGAWFIAVAAVAATVGVVTFSTRSAQAHAVGLPALLLGAAFFARYVLARALAHSIRVTDTHLELPASSWSVDTLSVRLESLSARLNDDGSIVLLRFGRDTHGFNRSWLGDRATRELLAVLTHRIETARARTAAMRDAVGRAP